MDVGQSTSDIIQNITKISFCSIIVLIILRNTIHIISWDKVYPPKCEGGLGICKSEYTKIAFLAKQ